MLILGTEVRPLTTSVCICEICANICSKPLVTSMALETMLIIFCKPKTGLSIPYFLFLLKRLINLLLPYSTYFPSHNTLLTLNKLNSIKQLFSHQLSNEFDKLI